MKQKRLLCAVLCSALMAGGTLPQIPVYAESQVEENLASQKTVFSSTKYYDNGQWNLQSLTDGRKLITTDYQNNAGFHSMENEGGTIVGVDLGEEKTFNNIRLYPRIDDQTNGALVSYVEDFTIEVSSDNSEWQTVKTITGNQNAMREPQDFSFDSVEARYVRINMTKSNDGDTVLALSEFEVYNQSIDTNDFIYQAYEQDFSSDLPNGSLVNINDMIFEEAIYEMDMSIPAGTSPEWVGFLFNRAKTSDTWDKSGYMLYMRSNGKLEFLESGKNDEIIIADIPDFQNSKPIHLKVTVADGSITVEANNQQVMKIQNSTYTSGYAGFWQSGGTGSKVENVKVTTKAPMPDDDETITKNFQEMKEKLEADKTYVDRETVSIPKTKQNYSIKIKKSSDENIIKTDGTISAPSEKTDVILTYELTYAMSDKIKTEDVQITVSVSPKTTLEDTAHFLDDKYGLFVHYVWSGKRNLTSDGSGGQPEQISARYPNGEHAQTIDEMIENFDAVQFAQDCEDMGMQYVIFTAWHYGTNPVYPSKVYEEWRTHEEADLPTDDGNHDLIDKVYQELNKKGIDLYLYTHPYDIHDFYEEDKEKFDYKSRGDLTFNYDLYNDYLNAQYKELCERYQGKIKGMFLDEGLANPANNLSVDYPRLRDTVKSVDPSLVMMQNEYNGKYSCDTSMWEMPTGWHGGSYNNLGSWKTNTIPIGTSIGNIDRGYSWWAIKNRGAGADGLESPENIYKYTVLQAGTNTEGGGIAWAAGPYCGMNQEGSEKNGVWEDGVKDTLVKVYEYMEPVEEAIKNTRPSKSFVTPAYSTINTVDWGVATESEDGKTTYVHVLVPPTDSKTVNLGVPADGKEFYEKAYIFNNNEDKGKEVAVSVDEKTGEVSLTLPEGVEWNGYQTVIALSTSEFGLELNKPVDVKTAELVGTTSAQYFDPTGVTDGAAGDGNGWHTADDVQDAYITIDLKENRTLSRMNVFPRTGNDAYLDRFAKDYDVYLSDESPVYTEIEAGDSYYIKAEISGLNDADLVASGSFERTDKAGTIYFDKNTKGRYLTLHVKNVQDGGDCINISEIGLYERNMEYPTAPVNVQAEANDSEIRLTWDAPEYPGTSEIQKYQVRCGESEWMDADSDSSHTFKNLENGKEYVVKVRAVNETTYGEYAKTTAVPEEKVSKKTLETLLNIAKGYVEDGTVGSLIESVQKLFNEAIAEGEAVMVNENAGKDEVINAELKLLYAIQSLDFVKGDTEDLEMALEIANEINLEFYVEKGKTEYLTAVDNAEKILDSNDALQDEVDEAWRALVQAMSDLRLKADKSVLEDLIKEAGQIDVQKYTERSVRAFQAVLAEAEDVLADETLSVDDQKQVDKSVEKLEKAMDKLVLKDSENNGSSGENDKSDWDNADSQKDKNNGNTADGRKDVPQTGDSAIGLYAAAALAVASGGVLFKRTRKRKR